jgi:hypothetical protein
VATRYDVRRTPAAVGRPARRWWALVAMALGLLAINLDFTVVNLGLAVAR